MFDKSTHEREAIALLDDRRRAAEVDRYADYRAGVVPRMLARMLFGVAAAVYGTRQSYKKFHAIEIIARIPYQSWELWSYMLQTGCFSDERKALALIDRLEFSRVAQDNETMHVVMLAKILREHERRGILRSVLFPLFISFLYFVACSLLYGIRRRWALELNFLFENHAYHAYDAFLVTERDVLRRRSLTSAYLTRYGRLSTNEYEFFELVRNDELLHRNRSIELIEKKQT